MRLHPLPYSCPWCGEPNRALADPSGGNRQEMVEDCRVCCRPIVLAIWQAGEEDWEVQARREE